jgi:hypothetical protein
LLDLEIVSGAEFELIERRKTSDEFYNQYCTAKQIAKAHLKLHGVKNPELEDEKERLRKKWMQVSREYFDLSSDMRNNPKKINIYYNQ